jgi:hypothetical protein
MGYDMYWRKCEDGEDGYFRLNIFGMSRYCDFMAEFGMAFNDAPHPVWPKTEDYGITDEDYWAVEEPEDYQDRLKTMTPETFAKVAEYQTAMTQVLTWHGVADTPGIPLHKFSTNDGWIVLPAECEAAVKAWQAYCNKHGEATALKRVGEPERQDYWKQWIAYLSAAAKHDGFEVH